jgi:hypothetical protein
MSLDLKPLLIFVGLLALGASAFWGWQHFAPTVQKATLNVQSNVTAETVLGEENLGATPVYLDDLDAGEFALKMSSGEQTYQTKIKLLGGTETTVRYNFAPNEVFTSGYTLWFEKTRGAPAVSVTSDPTDAQLRIDGTEKDKTPVFVDDLTPGEHTLRIEKAGFEAKELKVRVVDGHLLRVSVKLGINPLVDKPQVVESSLEKVLVYNLIADKNLQIVDQDTLLQGAVNWVAVNGLPKSFPQINYLLDSAGVVYNLKGEAVDVENLGSEDGKKLEELSVGYLNLSEEGLSEKAQAALENLAKKVLKTPPPIKKVRILPTGTGWLRVRSEPSLSAKEITKVNVDESFPLLEEGTGWVKIKLADGNPGWVSSDFVEVFEETPSP